MHRTLISIQNSNLSYNTLGPEKRVQTELSQLLFRVFKIYKFLFYCRIGSMLDERKIRQRRKTLFTDLNLINVLKQMRVMRSIDIHP